jgi:ribosomal protein S18 acetylase RimI-like enzyme
MYSIASLEHTVPSVAESLHAILVLAHAQETRLVQSSRPAPRERSALDIQASAEHFLGATLGLELVGSLSVGLDDEPGQINVASLVVHPAHQRRGVALLLMQEALRRGHGSVFSVVTTASNVPALALYASLGFVEYRRGTAGVALVPMVKLRRAGSSAAVARAFSGAPG